MSCVLLPKQKGEGTCKIERDLPGHVFEHEVSPMCCLEAETASSSVQTPSEPTDWWAKAARHKEKGNSLYRVGEKLVDATREYKRALHCLRRVPRDQKAAGFRAACYLNLTACALSLGEHADARKYSTKALKLDPNNVKALYRRAHARKYAAFDLPGAEKDLELAQQLAPDDEIVKKALLSLKKDQARSKELEKIAARKMFNQN